MKEMNRKNIPRTFIALLAVALLSACAATPPQRAGNTEAASVATVPAAVSLDQAVAQTASAIRAKTPQNTKIAVVEFASESANLSDYLMEELNFALLDEGLSVIDRANLNAVRQELNFQMSGEVDEESALSIGKFLGVDYVVTGQFRLTGAEYRFAVTLISVKSAARESAVRLDVRNDERTRKLVETLGKTSVQSHSAGY
ncbi:MAG: CsgG/HfaB family protein [Treponema sp.]|jgi:TolB-like protein|nr:CsgG/HfaB family protein [Treponema sp.]